MKKHHNPPFPLDQTSPFVGQEQGSYPIGIKPEVVELQQQFNTIEAARRDIVIPLSTDDPPLIVGNIDMCKLRDLLFSVRDNGIYCSLCRCPEFGASPERRSAHYEECALGLMCEALLKQYPKDGLTVTWRK